ncbi:hypothetical protein G6F59_017397 [Rhizopus arrhizus]|nr:hypothetical protein G6F59_017397 [Rhizopus arrhizus]
MPPTISTRVGELRRRDDLLAGDAEGEVEVHRVDDVDLGAISGLRLAQAGVQQRQFVADVAAQNDDAVGAFDLGQRQAEHFGGPWPGGPAARPPRSRSPDAPARPGCRPGWP